MNRALFLLLLVLFPLVLVAERATPSIGFAGAPTDHGGQTCVTCHNSFPLNPAGGSLTVTVGDYTPSRTQLIAVAVQFPQAARAGFQITIRQVSDETKTAGTFTPAVDPIQVRCDDGSQFGGAPPCNSLREFGEHVNAPQTNNGTFEFDLTWTPPTTEVGDLHVYVTAVAADGDGTPLNDRVYTFVKTISPVGGCALNKKPTLQTALNGASFQPPFSSNAMISVFGLGFEVSGRTRTAGLGDFVNGGFPPSLGCVAVEVTGPGITTPVRLPIAYVQPDQINAQAPVFTGTGPVMLTVIINPGKPNELRSDLATLNSLQPFAPAFFVFAPSKSIAAQIAGTATIVANPAVVSGGRPAKPGEIVSLYGTGFGDTNPSVATGQLATGAASLTNSITVIIGGVTLASGDVLYAGLSPGSISGLYQFNVRVPASVSDGDVPVSISIGGFQTQAGTTIPVQH
ncbi:MAG TPA: choice-of-anchor V domain-containing protein [Bryobacteraceae bacterium]|nr:choice-of-anchor V domain-containing protein [Bryobacteraceae bacterium]